jgi:PAS domain S-box-containing protein
MDDERQGSDRAEDMLKRAERAARIGCWELDLELGVMTGSEGALAIYGVSDRVQLLESVKTLPLPEYRAALDSALAALIAGTAPYDIAFKIRRPSDGAIVDIHSTAEFDPARKKVYGVIQDIGVIAEAKAALEESEGKYRALFRDNDLVMLLIEPESGAILDANEAALRFYGWSREELLARRITEINTLSREEVGREMAAARARRKRRFDFRHRLADGSIRDVEVYSGPIVIGGRTLLYSIVHDMTEATKAKADNERLLKEKELLLQEVHHRIKNNMEMIASLLSLQSQSVASEEASEALTEARGRVLGMMELYDRLYRSPDFRTVNAREYFESLMREIGANYAAGRPIAIETEVEDMMLDARVLVPLGIVVNELISNAFKYAFPAHRPGAVRLAASRLPSGEIELSIRDDGIGIGEGADRKPSSGFGLVLVEALAAQIGARISTCAEGGTLHRIVFPEGGAGGGAAN